MGVKPWPVYGTHVPVLRALGKALRVRHAVEYGSGRYSTPSLLDAGHFPGLEELTSVEHNEGWAKDAAARNRDYRLRVLRVPLAEMAKVELPEAELVLIDCGDTVRDYAVRAELLAKHRGGRAVVVLHDVDDGGLARASGGYRHRRVYAPPSGGPATAVLSMAPLPELAVDWACDWPDLPARVYACITSRDGRILDDVLLRVSKACLFARKAGVCEYEMTRARDSYSAPACRNKAVADFIKRTEYTHLWFIDDDVLVQEDALAVLASTKRAIAAGCYPQVRYPEDGGPQYLYITAQTEKGWFRGWFDGEAECVGAGTGCMLIAREVFEAVGFPWFRWPETNEAGKHGALSDDVDFCQRAARLGHKTYAYGRVRCGHLKQSDLAAWTPHATEEGLRPRWRGPQTVQAQLEQEKER